MDKAQQLGTESIGKLLIKFSVPAMIGMIVMASYNIVDRIFVGQGVGALALSGITVTFPLMLIGMGFGMLVGIGSTALVSIRLGEQKKDEAELILGNAFTLSVIIGVALTIFGYLTLEPMLILFGAEGEVLVFAKQFADIFIFAALFQMISFSLNYTIRGQGDPKTAMATLIISAVINVILNPIFIFVLHLGIRGSAYASVIAQFISAVWILSYFFSKRSLLRLHFKNMKLNFRIVKGITSIGVSAFSMQIAGSVVMIIFNTELAQHGGNLAIAAMGIGNSIGMMILMPIFGLNQGVQPILGYNYGAKQFDRVMKALKLATIAATIICVSGFIVVNLFSTSIVMMFCHNDAKLLEIGSHGLRILLLMCPIIGFQIISTSYFQAIGKPIHSLILTLSRQVIFLIPLLLILPRYFQLEGVWMSAPIADGVSSTLAFIFLFFEIKRLTAKHEIQKVIAG